MYVGCDRATLYMLHVETPVLYLMAIVPGVAVWPDPNILSQSSNTALALYPNHILTP